MNLTKVSFVIWAISLLVLGFSMPWFSLITQVLNIFESNFVLLWKEILVILNFFFGIVLILNSSRHRKLSRFNQFIVISLPSITSAALLWGVIRALDYGLPTFNIFLGLRFEWFWLLWLVFYVWWYFFDQVSLVGYIQKLPVKFLSKSIIIGFLSQAIIGGVLGQQKIIDLLSGFSQPGLTNLQVCNPIDFGIDVCRLQGIFNSPNHFAGVGLFALALSLQELLNTTSKRLFIYSLTVGAILVSIYFSYSRYAWFGAGLLVSTYTGCFILNKLKILSSRNLKIMIAFQWVLSVAAILIFLVGFSSFLTFLPNAVIKPSSSTEHLRHKQIARDIIFANSSNFWLGFGVGSSGSAAHPIYYEDDITEQNPIIKNYGQVSFKYGVLPHRLSIPESWFLQVWLNGGLVYLIIYVILSCSIYFIFIYRSIYLKSQFYLLASTGVLTIIVGNLILHIWENQSISLGMTLLFLIILGININNPETKDAL